MPRKAIWFLAVGLVATFLVLNRIGQLRARVVVFNQSGRAIGNAVVANQTFASVGNGESRAAWLESGEDVVLSFRFGDRTVRWRSDAPLAVGDSLLLTIRDDGRVDAHHGLSGSR